MLKCFQKGIFERKKCEEYDPMSMKELDEKDAFVNAIMVGPCPKCNSENTIDCGNHPLIEDPTVGYCRHCSNYFCTECSYVFKSQEKKSCPHWSICRNCPDQSTEEYPDACPYEAFIYECPQIQKWLRQNKIIEG